nr:MAG TPA: hypothetical protein [Caudoviricetes sp.]
MQNYILTNRRAGSVRLGPNFNYNTRSNYLSIDILHKNNA